MGGYIRSKPGRVVFDETIATGATLNVGIVGATAKQPQSRYLSWPTPLPPSSSAKVLAATASTSGDTTTVSTGLSNPDYPRAVRVCPSTSQVATTSVIVNGTDQFGATAQDTIVMAGGSPVNGVVAFKTITSVVLPASTSGANGSPTFTIGLSNVFGLDRQVFSVAAAIRGAVNGTAETTAPILNATYHTASFTTSATSSAGAKVELLYQHMDVLHA